MKEKFLMLTMSLLVVTVIVGPVVWVNGEEKEVLTWIKIHEPGAEKYWENYIPKEGEYFKSFTKSHCDVGGYKLNLGGQLDWDYFWDPDLGYWVWRRGIIGGTTFEMGTDFDYEGRIYAKFSYYENMNTKTMNFSIIGTYTFDPSSPNHNIDGTIKFHSRSNFTLTPYGYITGSYSKYNGHGTGDLKGVIVQASKAPSIWDPDMKWQFVSTQIGTVRGWPTQFNTPPRADIYIEHTYRGSLRVDIGVGDPSSPTWMQRVWYYEGRSADNLDLTVVLSAAAAYLPPDGNQWFLRVYDGRYGDEGQITEFSITYDGTTYTSTDPPVRITDMFTSYAYIPGLAAHADIYIEHTARRDLIVEIGVGDPSSPTWSQRIWNGYGGDADNLGLTLNLASVTAYLPPDGNQWFLKVYDRYTGDEGQITEFSITYDGTTYASTDPPVPITDLMTSYAYIPNL